MILKMEWNIFPRGSEEYANIFNMQTSNYFIFLSYLHGLEGILVCTSCFGA